MAAVLCLLAAASFINASPVDKRQASTTATVSASTTVPLYFQTTPELFPLFTQTGSAPYLAETNPAPFGIETGIVPAASIQTQIPIAGAQGGLNDSIFYYMGNLSPYFPSPGFGADEYPLPPGANITQVQALSRHGSRYPTSGSAVQTFGSLIKNVTTNGTGASFSGELSFLNTWKYKLGAEILIPRGREELFSHGIQKYYQYGALYDTASKIIIRSTDQDRMTQSAEYFASGFFGQTWVQNATLELIIDQVPFNNSLAGYNACPNANNFRSTGGNNASVIWEESYLKAATARFQALTKNFNWTIADTYNAQTLCPYETVALGYSVFCDLFTFQEWQGFEYSLDLQFDGGYGFAGPAARAIGIGWVEEFYARLQGHLYNLPPGSTSVNTTLDEMPSTFPTNQTLYFDFTHDTNIASVITAFGLTQFNQSLTSAGPPANQQMIVSHMEPFGARLVIEVITTPHPVKAARPATNNQTTADYYESGNTTSYVHFTLNQRTIPLNASYTQCGDRDDGWCELGTFMSILESLLAIADFEYACFANYSTPAFGSITNGVEPRSVNEIRSVEEMKEVEVRDMWRLHKGMGSGLASGEWAFRN